MKLWIRGNSLRFRVSKTGLARLAETGKAEETARFPPEPSLRYGIEVRPTGGMTAALFGESILVTVPKGRLDRRSGEDGLVA